MSRNEMVSTGHFYADEMLKNECALKVFTILLIFGIMWLKEVLWICSPHTPKYPMLHTIEIYLIVFMGNKSFSEYASESESVIRMK